MIAGLLILIAVPLGLTWREVRQERLNQALIAAIKRNDTNSVTSLLEQGADANTRDDPGRKISIWQRLMNQLQGRSSVTADAPTALFQATFWHAENPTLAQILLRHHAAVNAQDPYGNTALINCIRVGKGKFADQVYNPTLQALLQAHADVSLPNRNGETPLYFARLFERPEAIRLLKQAGAK